MSVNDVQTVRTIFDVFNREGVEATEPFVHPELEVVAFPEWVGPPAYHGTAGLGAVVAEWTENFDDYHWDVEDVLEASRGTVVILARQWGRTKGEGVALSQAIGAVFDLRDGRVVRMRYFLTWEEALAAGGLSPRRSGAR